MGSKWVYGEYHYGNKIHVGAILSHHRSRHGAAKRSGVRTFDHFRSLGSRIILGVLTIHVMCTLLVNGGCHLKWRGKHKRKPLHQPTSHLSWLHGGEIVENELTFQRFLEHAFGYEPARRRGEAIHDLLKVAREDLFDRLEGTAIDPVNDNRLITACLDWLEENWDT